MRQVTGTTLWLGHAGDRRDVRTCLAAGIEAVIDLALEEPPVPTPREIVCCRFPLLDGPGNPPWLLRAAVATTAAFARAQVPTLVSCSAGMSRSPAVAAAALAGLRGCTLPEALQAVVRNGPADVAPGLWHELTATIGSWREEKPGFSEEAGLA